MNIEEKAALLDWIVEQDRLRVETWHYMGGRQTVHVWTLHDPDEDTPSGKASTVVEALQLARQHAIATERVQC